MIGRVVETLGTLTVLRALPLLSRQFPEVHLDVVGDLPLPSELKHVAQDSNVFGRVTFHGSPGRQRIVELLREADVFCCVPGAETEHYRQALHEALACGLPVVTSSTEIAPMLMRKGCAIVLKEETPTALAEAVMDCLSDSDRYVRMSGEALRTAQEYSLERWRETVRCALENAWGPLRSVQ